MKAVLCCVLSCWSGVALAGGGVINVPGDFPTIQQAISGADPGAEIVVAPGVYPEIIAFFDRAVTVRSSGGPGVTTIEPVGDGTVVNFQFGSGRDAVLEGFTITGGTGIAGGVYFSNSSGTVRDCVITGNNSTFAGGGINITGTSAPHIVGCIISANTVTSRGGGISIATGSGPTLIEDCVIEDHHVPGPGGGVNASGDTVFRGCVIRDNTGGSTAGGAAVDLGPSASKAASSRTTATSSTAGASGSTVVNTPSTAAGSSATAPLPPGVACASRATRTL